uniref:Uncharacterized protein n=1 Tax=Spongospora subterranea TaxID=70186 RepID=A0A0H5QUZ7_9EUKA|eukprot:CRZ05391.1 hypothetical protein [Spongospora subterranea]
MLSFEHAVEFRPCVPVSSSHLHQELERDEEVVVSRNGMTVKSSPSHFRRYWLSGIQWDDSDGTFSFENNRLPPEFREAAVAYELALSSSSFRDEALVQLGRAPLDYYANTADEIPMPATASAECQLLLAGALLMGCLRVTRYFIIARSSVCVRFWNIMSDMDSQELHEAMLESVNWECVVPSFVTLQLPPFTICVGNWSSRFLGKWVLSMPEPILSRIPLHLLRAAMKESVGDFCIAPEWYRYPETVGPIDTRYRQLWQGSSVWDELVVKCNEDPESAWAEIHSYVVQLEDLLSVPTTSAEIKALIAAFSSCELEKDEVPNMPFGYPYYTHPALSFILAVSVKHRKYALAKVILETHGWKTQFQVALDTVGVPVNAWLVNALTESRPDHHFAPHERDVFLRWSDTKVVPDTLINVDVDALVDSLNLIRANQRHFHDEITERPERPQSQSPPRLTLRFLPPWMSLTPE